AAVQGGAGSGGRGGGLAVRAEGGRRQRSVERRLKETAMTKQKPSPDFDFFMGIWTCRHRYLARRLADCHDWLEFDGSCAARKVLHGYGNPDEKHIQLPGSPYKGLSLRHYHPP